MANQLPLLNFDFALNQLGGNESLLSKMLGKFVTEFEHCASEVANFCEHGDYKNAKMKVHTVKGISGNLGLQALYECATKFDAELRNEEFTPSVFEEFSALIIDTCAEIKKRDQIEDPARSFEKTTYSLQTSKLELIKRLKRNEFIDDDTLVDLVSGLELSESKANRLVELIEELQYQEAIELVDAS
ncbi:Hpt domain-containing protein [Glaciecola sp. MH2013]|uniref:Hpt domain-containing protein n=1 Tax=Glaciecola sp. MH2013 TaxID=2785524 RepID=UPI00189C78EB|nr:Hpt domain-containing protein [Glaciecola sp. MH2013]MBF7072461.1 Hpt domain-containing protein [Glaciecola sp. MH2013]